METVDSLTRAQESLQKEVSGIFNDTLGLIHIALVTHYGLEEGEATELEKDLHLWFLRFCVRPGNSSPQDSRPFLVVACCQFAREYQKFVIGSGCVESSEKINSFLNANRPMSREIFPKLRVAELPPSRCLNWRVSFRSWTRRESAALSPDEAKQSAQAYLSTCRTQRMDSMVDRVLSNPDVLASVCALLREMFQTAPARVADEAAALHTQIRNPGRPLGLFRRARLFPR